MNKLDPQVRDVYAEYGCVMGEAQLLERYLVYLILAAYEPESSNKLTPKEYDSVLAHLSERTLGGLIQRLKRSFEVPPTFECRLRETQRLRNWVAHHYFADRANEFQTQTGWAEMTRELDEIGDELHKLVEYFDDLLSGWLSDHASSTEELVERFCRTAGEA